MPARRDDGLMNIEGAIAVRDGRAGPGWGGAGRIVGTNRPAAVAAGVAGRDQPPAAASFVVP